MTFSSSKNILLSLVSFFVFLMFPLYSAQKSILPPKIQERYSLTEGKVVAIPAKKATLPLIVYGDEAGQVGTFIPSGYMGDSAGIELKTVDDSVPLKNGAPGVHALKISYLSEKKLRAKSNREGWAGVYWQTPANNWAKIKGAGYDLREAKRLTFWLKGEKGGEVLAEAKMGGLVGPYPDTDVSVIGPLKLTNEWKKFAIDLEGKDLRHILGGFAFSVRRADNPHGLSFYLDEVLFEGPESETSESLTPVTSLSPSTLSSADSKKEESLNETQDPLEVTVKYSILFKDRDITLEPSSKGILEEALQKGLRYSCKILVEGHTDDFGSSEVNKKISVERAKSVVEFLVAKGIKRQRITVEGFGEKKPFSGVLGKMTEEDRVKNRRVDITLLAREKP